MHDELAAFAAAEYRRRGWLDELPPAGRSAPVGPPSLVAPPPDVPLLVTSAARPTSADDPFATALTARLLTPRAEPAGPDVAAHEPATDRDFERALARPRAPTPPIDRDDLDRTFDHRISQLTSRLTILPAARRADTDDDLAVHLAHHLAEQASQLAAPADRPRPSDQTLDRKVTELLAEDDELGDLSAPIPAAIIRLASFVPDYRWRPPTRCTRCRVLVHDGDALCPGCAAEEPEEAPTGGGQPFEEGLFPVFVALVFSVAVWLWAVNGAGQSNHGSTQPVKAACSPTEQVAAATADGC